MERSDGEMARRLLERLRLVVAMSDSLATETKLVMEPMISEMLDVCAMPEAQHDQPLMRRYWRLLSDAGEQNPDVEALLGALRNFLSYL